MNTTLYGEDVFQMIVTYQEDIVGQWIRFMSSSNSGKTRDIWYGRILTIDAIYVDGPLSDHFVIHVNHCYHRNHRSDTIFKDDHAEGVFIYKNKNIELKFLTTAEVVLYKLTGKYEEHHPSRYR